MKRLLIIILCGFTLLAHLLPMSAVDHDVTHSQSGVASCCDIDEPTFEMTTCSMCLEAPSFTYADLKQTLSDQEFANGDWLAIGILPSPPTAPPRLS